MAILINGNGNPAIYAAQDADLIASLAGNTTGIAKVGNEFAYTAEDANTISVADGVIVTKEGRRIQLDAGENDTFTIPAGTAGVTNYYIIGYHLHENASGQQVADTFVQLMANATDTIQEDTFRGGASDVYVSLYRVEQDGVNLGTITLLLPKLANISQVNSNLAGKISDDLAYQVIGETGVVKDFHIFKAGNNVVMSGKITISGGGTFGNNTKLLTVPEALRPSANRNCNFVVFGDMNSGTFGELVVGTNGAISAHFDDNTFAASIARFSCSWTL